jgi:hypothetical protein
MTTLRDELLETFNDVRGLIDDLGLRRYAVTVRIRTWSGSDVGLGSATTADTVLTPTPRVRVLREAEIASSGGTYRTGDYRVDKITPAYALPGSVTAAIVGTGTIAPEMLVPDAGIVAGVYAVVAQIVTDGDVGIATFQVSTDGGATFGSTLVTAATYQIPDIGIRLSLAGSFLAGDQVSFLVSAGGYTPLQLNPVPLSSQDRVHVLAGDNDDEMICTLAGSLDFSRSFGYSFVLRPRRESPSA